MLTKPQFQKFLKPLCALLISKTIIFLSIVILIMANHQVGFSTDNTSISYSDAYLTLKISQYQTIIQVTTFLMALFGSLVSVISGACIVFFYIRIRKHQKQRLQQGSKFSENRLRFHFIAIFIESLCILNICLRSIERLKQYQVCNLQGKSYFITVIILSSLLLCIIITSYALLFRLLSLFKQKNLALQEFSYYSDQVTLKQNLFFNKNGYIKEINKMENCVTPTHSLKDGIIKNFPSGFKKGQHSAAREILHRLRGGNKNSTQSNSINKEKFNKKKDDFDEFQNNLNQETHDTKRKLKPQSSKENKQIHERNLLSVNQKTFQQSPNEQNFQSIETALNVMQLSISNQREILRQKDQNSFDDNSSMQKVKQSHKNEGIFKVKRVQSDIESKQNENLQQKIVQNNGKHISMEVKEDQQLKQRFNLTPNVEARKDYQGTKNYQNIDQNDHYYVVDVDKIKKKTKFLTSNNLKNDTDHIDPNILYSKGTWVPKMRRVGKKHETNVQAYLQNLQKIRKQEMLCQEDQSSYSESFEENSLSSQISETSSQNQNKANPNNEVKELTQIKQKKVKKEPIATELYLHLKRKKNLYVQNKLKLFEDEEGFYEEQEEQSQSSRQDDSQLQKSKNNGVQILQISDKPPVRQQSLEKTKVEQKINLKNKQMQTQQARMLRFLRKKYIEPTKIQISQKLNVTFANEEQNSQNKEVV